MKKFKSNQSFTVHDLSSGVRYALVACFALTQFTGCSSNCFDDGFAWQQDELCAAGTEATETNTTGMTDTMTGPTATDTMTGPTATETETMTGPTATNTMTMTGPTTSGNGSVWCEDNDMDGFGDPENCTNVPDGQEPPPGSVPEPGPGQGDCDDMSANTYPGAAELDSETLCMTDEDGDGYGKENPGPGVDAGTDCADDNVDAHPNIDPDNPEACLLDKDKDGKGEPDPLDPNIDAGNDCDDSDPFTFPGAAPNDDPAACMTDKDDDDWGDDSPENPDVMAGTDCDDTNPNTYKGAAELEDPTACMNDEDDDGWGNTNPGPSGSGGSITPGADCYDSNFDINPDTTQLVSMANGINGDVVSVDPATGMVTPFATVDTSGLPGWDIVSATLDPGSGLYYATNNSDYSLYSVDYCSDTPPTKISTHNFSLCGITFDLEGNLYGIDDSIDMLVQLDPETGEVVGVPEPLTLDGGSLNIGQCGVAFDCVKGEILVADSFTKKVYSVDLDTAETTVVASEGDAYNFGRGLAYNPVAKNVYSCSGISSFEILIDNSNTFTQLPDLTQGLDDIGYGPVCN
ncbi:MAG: DUF6923 family protein [Nannocystaceae bacterium]